MNRYRGFILLFAVLLTTRFSSSVCEPKFLGFYSRHGFLSYVWIKLIQDAPNVKVVERSLLKPQQSRTACPKISLANGENESSYNWRNPRTWALLHQRIGLRLKPISQFVRVRCCHETSLSTATAGAWCYLTIAVRWRSPNSELGASVIHQDYCTISTKIGVTKWHMAS